MSRLIRIYHPYWKWEEIQYNMWGASKNRKQDLQIAISFTGDDRLYGEWMKKVADNWKYSCEHNLSNTEQNRKAWIGHAAMAYAMQIPEDIVRQAWSHLTEDQQIRANQRADEAIKYWEESCLKQD